MDNPIGEVRRSTTYDTMDGLITRCHLHISYSSSLQRIPPKGTYYLLPCTPLTQQQSTHGVRVTVTEHSLCDLAVG